MAMISDSMQKIMDAFPQPTALLDPEKKMITVNTNFLKLFSYPSGDHLIGKKPEEIFNCIYAIDTFYDNRIASQCRKCGENLNMKDSEVSCNRFR